MLASIAAEVASDYIIVNAVVPRADLMATGW